MVTGAYLLLALGGILYLGGWVMLLVLGFKKSLGWGLVMLFLSWLIIPLIVFLIKYWDEAKLGFLVMVGGLLAAGVGGFVLVGSVATSAMAEFESFDLGQPQIQEEPADSTYSAVEPEPTEVEPEPESADDTPATGESEAEPEAERPPPAGAVLGERVEWKPLEDPAGLAAYEGEMVELHMTDGTQIRVILDSVRDDSLKVTQRVGGGSMAYSVNRNLVAEIWVVK